MIVTMKPLVAEEITQLRGAFDKLHVASPSAVMVTWPLYTMAA